VTFICHELTEYTRRLLVAGTVDAVIDQNPRVEVRDAVEWLIHAAERRPPPALPPIRIQAIFKENIPQV
jgi:LacI family transcriptional regulator